MGIARFIARHPVVVVAVWLILALVSAPLFASLHTVVKTTRYSLPPSSEAEKANKLLAKLGGGENIGIVIVEGPYLRDNDTLLRLVEWGRAFNETFYERGLGGNVTSVPVMLASINDTIYEMLLKGIREGAKGARQGYEQLAKLNETFVETRVNMTEMVDKLREALKGVMEADRGYAEGYKGLMMLVEGASMVVDGLRRIDFEVWNATNMLIGLGEKLNETSVMLALLDEKAALFARNVTGAASLLESTLRNYTLVSRMSQGLAYTWWQVSRAYRYLEAFNGNYTMYVMYTNLSAVNPAFAPLPEDEAIAVWRSVKSLAEKLHDVDLAALKVASELVASQTPEQAKPLVNLTASLLWERLAEKRSELGIETLTSLYSLDASKAAESQLAVLKLVQEAAGNVTSYIVGHASELAVKLLAERLEQLGLSRELAEKIAEEAVYQGRVDAKDAVLAVATLAAGEYPDISRIAPMAAEVVAEYDPSLEGRLASQPRVALDAAAELLSRLGAPAEAVKAVEKLVAEGIWSRRAYASLAYKLAAEKLSSIDPRAAALVPIVEKYDPAAEKLLVTNSTLLKEAALEALYKTGGEKLSMLPRSVVEGIVERVVEGNPPTPEELKRIALELVVEKASEAVGREQAEMIASILERWDPNAEGTLAANETLAARALAEAVVEASGGKIPLDADTLASLILHPEKLNETLCSIFRSEALKRVPPEAKPLVEEALSKLCARGYLTPDDIWSLVGESIEEKMSEMKLNVSFEIPSWLRSRMADAIIEAAKGADEHSLAARLARDLLLGVVAPKLLEETRGMLVANDYKGFVVMFNVSGESREERAENILEAGRLVNETLPRYTHVDRVYVTGPDLLMHEVREHALHDAEKTSKISEVATFIVLLLILESLFAVILPYIGIGLGLVFGGALVYIAAKMGIISVDSTAQSLMITTALGLGADYAAYLVHRFREEYAIRGDAREAAEEALRRAGPAIVASAATVIIGFASLLLGWDIVFLRSIGETIPVTVAATALASLTLVPALLALLGGKRWFWWPRRPRPERHAGRESRLMSILYKHHRIVLAAILVVFIVAGYYYATFHGSHDMKLMLPENALSIRAFDVLREKYLPGLTDPVYVVAELPGNVYESKSLQDAIHALAETLRGIDGVGKVIAPNFTSGMTQGLVSEDGRIVALRVILSVDPYSSKGEEAIKEIHEKAHEFAESHGFKVYVGGAPYAVLEMDAILRNIFYQRIIPVSSLLMVAAFTGIFGAIPASLAALAVVIGSAMTGITLSILLFKVLMGKEIVWFLHIVALAAVMGVGMDYNSFFLARALEECQRNHCADVEQALRRAAGAVSLFIIGLAFVVASAYMSMLASSTVGMREMGFTLGVTVLLAGLMASYLLTPLVIALLGKHAWWPRGLKKRIEH